MNKDFNSLNNIIDNYLSQPNFDSLSVDNKLELKNKIYEDFLKSFYIGLFQNLDESYHKELSILIQENDLDNLSSFLIVNMEDYPAYEQKMIIDFVENLTQEVLKNGNNPA